MLSASVLRQCRTIALSTFGKQFVQREHFVVKRSLLTFTSKPATVLDIAVKRERHISGLKLENSIVRFSANCSSSTLKNMEEHCVVPDVISKVPKAVCKVTYNSGVEVNQGNILKPRQVKDAPVVTWEADQNAMYTLCMTDPDAPSRTDPKFREWHHWLVGNIPGNDVKKGEVLSAYIGSGPPEGTGLHRYVFLIYKQECELEFEEQRLPNNSGNGRGGFKIANFAEKYTLGNPIAGNFYQAEWDDYVPELYKQLGG